VELGSGTLEIHLLTGRCFFEGVAIDPLPISQELQVWFAKELARQSISADTLKSARVKANIQLSIIPSSEHGNKSEVFYVGGQIVHTQEMHRCIIECGSEISTDKATFTSHIGDIEEWPTGWPAPGWSSSRPT